MTLGAGSVLLTQELKPIDVGCGIESVDIHGLHQILGRREPAIQSEGEEGESCATYGNPDIRQLQKVIST